MIKQEKWEQTKHMVKERDWEKKFRKSKIVKDRAPKSKKTPTPPYPHPF